MQTIFSAAEVTMKALDLSSTYYFDFLLDIKFKVLVLMFRMLNGVLKDQVTL